MALRVNLVVAAIGVVLALSSASYMAANWEALVGLETWEARFETQERRLPERAASLAPNSVRNELHTIPVANVTRIVVDLTWQDPSFNPPEITVRLLDPDRAARAEESHTGGAIGIQLEADILDPDDVPAGAHTFRVRQDPQDLNAQTAFESRWPTYTESQGTWTIEIRSTAPPGPGPSGDVFYSLSTRYAFYTGTFVPLPEPLR